MHAVLLYAIIREHKEHLIRLVKIWNLDLLCFLRIFNEMKTLQSLLSQQSPVQPYISALINITQVILEYGQGKSAS